MAEPIKCEYCNGTGEGRFGDYCGCRAALQLRADVDAARQYVLVQHIFGLIMCLPPADKIQFDRIYLTQGNPKL